MFHLAHISDVHLQPLPEVKLTDLLNKRITGYLNWKLNRKHSLANGYFETLIADMKAQKADHTVVTGDLVNLSLPEEFTRALSFLESLGPAENVTALCGNHDAYVPGALKMALSSWQNYVNSDGKSLDDLSAFPILRRRDDIAIISCNSAKATLPFMATGYFLDDQAKRLAQLLTETEGACRIVCIHHPPLPSATKWHKRLIGEDRFRDVVRQCGAELVLHGHTHLATINKTKGKNGDVPVVCVPAAGTAHGGHRPAGRYNLFAIEKSKTGWSIEMKARACNADGSGIETVEAKIL